MSAETCSVVETNCLSPANLDPIRPVTGHCFACGEAVCKNCSKRIRYLAYGKKKICKRCIYEESRRSHEVMEHRVSSHGYKLRSTWVPAQVLRKTAKRVLIRFSLESGRILERWVRPGTLRKPGVSSERSSGLSEAHQRLFWNKVNKTDGCWLWMAARTPEGYGKFVTNIEGISVNHFAHRISWNLLIGPIPEGLQIDHLCRVTQCVNPAHLRVTTLRENVLAALKLKTHCKHGHPLSGANLYLYKGKYRICRQCRVDRRLRREL